MQNLCRQIYGAVDYNRADSKGAPRGCFLAVFCLQAQRWGTLHVYGSAPKMSSCAYTGHSHIEGNNLLILSNNSSLIQAVQPCLRRVHSRAGSTSANGPEAAQSINQLHFLSLGLIRGVNRQSLGKQFTLSTKCSRRLTIEHQRNCWSSIVMKEGASTATPHALH